MHEHTFLIAITMNFQNTFNLKLKKKDMFIFSTLSCVYCNVVRDTDT